MSSSYPDFFLFLQSENVFSKTIVIINGSLNISNLRQDDKK